MDNDLRDGKRCRKNHHVVDLRLGNETVSRPVMLRKRIPVSIVHCSNPSAENDLREGTSGAPNLPIVLMPAGIVKVAGVPTILMAAASVVHVETATKSA